jgi:hypothetical protein
MTPFELILLGLGVFRLTRLVVRDEITAEIRNRIWNRYPPNKSMFGYLFTCEWCMSIWLASLFYLSSTIAPAPTRVLATILALSAVAGLLAAYEDK